MLTRLKAMKLMFSLTLVGAKVKLISPRTLLSLVCNFHAAPQSRLTWPVMLRALEYFKGILIMTTNRVMTFDVAMLSRCHYAVNFESITLKQEQDIWQGYIKQLTPQNSARKGEIESWIQDILTQILLKWPRDSKCVHDCSNISAGRA